MRNSLILYRNLKYGELFQRMGSLLEEERGEGFTGESGW